jgi:malic enzyme
MTTNGTAVLGFGDIGRPVMAGKGCWFEKVRRHRRVPTSISKVTDPEQVIEVVAAL